MAILRSYVTHRLGLTVCLGLIACSPQENKPTVDASVVDASLSQTAKASLKRAKLFDRLEKSPGDAAARRALTPLLTAEDRGRIALMLSKERWGLPGFFQYVRWMKTVDPKLLAPPVQTALGNVARNHPKDQVREWAVEALAELPGLKIDLFAELAMTGSIQGLRTQVERSPDGFDALKAATASTHPRRRNAAYEVLIAPAKLDFEFKDAHRAQLLELVLSDIDDGIEGKPWIQVRLVNVLTKTRPQLSPALQARMVTSLRAYCITEGNQKPWWDALMAVQRLETPASIALIEKAVTSVPTEKGRAVMRDRLGLK